MLEWILDYLEKQGVVFGSGAELEEAAAGVRLFLTENGIQAEEQRPYFRRYLERCLGRIEPRDLKAFFRLYPDVSRVRQICMEWTAGKPVEPDQAAQLWDSMARLYRAGLGDRYIPAAEVQEILGRLI